MAGDLRDIIAAALVGQWHPTGEANEDAAEILAAIRAALTADPTRLEDLGCEQMFIRTPPDGDYPPTATGLFRAPQSTEENA